MKFPYYIRVFFLSFQFLAALAGLAIFLLWGEAISTHFEGIKLNDEGAKWLVVFPITIAGWILKAGVEVLFPDEKSAKTLHEWPDYWKLKAHFHVGLCFCFLLVIPCVVIWLFNKLGTFEWAWFFCVSVTALVINAYSFYSAKIELKSFLLHIN